jgi:CelD/BcsL family acetyltransferase involved in cellulose biosynthesis
VNTHSSVVGSPISIGRVRTELHSGSPDDLASEWEELFEADPEATPFVSPGWGLAWIRHLANGAEPWLLTVRDGHRLVGLAPLALDRRRRKAVLRTIGKEPGDYWDVLAVPEHRDAVTAAVAAEIAGRDDQWDSLFVAGQPGGSIADALAEQDSLVVRGRAAIPCPRIALPADFDEYLRSLPGSHRSNVRKHLRRLDQGPVHVREVTDVAELDDVIARWHELHIKRWAALPARIDPTHLEPSFRAFMLDAMRALVPLGLACVSEFVVGGEVVGVYVNLVDEQAFYWYLGGFEPSRAKLGVGKMSVAHGIRWSIETGRRFFDFTRGEESFKYYFGAVDRQCPVVMVGNRRLRSRSALALSGVRHRLGQARQAARSRTRLAVP